MSAVASASEVETLPRRRRRRWVWWVALGTMSVSLVVFFRAFDVAAVAEQLRAVSLPWFAVAVLANFAVLPLMSEQWFRLLPWGATARRTDLWECLAPSMAAMNTLPLGGGHAVAVGLLASRGVTTVSGAVSLLALEQVCEGLARVALLLAALGVAPLPPLLERAFWGLAVVVIFGLVGLGWLATHSARNPGATGWRAQWGRHLEVLRRPAAFVVATLLGIVAKGAMLLAVYAVQRSMGAPVSFTATPLVLAAVTFATGVALSPGNVGVYELAAAAAYRLLGAPAGQAAALGLVLHAAFLLPMLGTGYGLMLWRALRPRGARAEP